MPGLEPKSLGNRYGRTWAPHGCNLDEAIYGAARRQWGVQRGGLSASGLVVPDDGDGNFVVLALIASTVLLVHRPTG